MGREKTWSVYPGSVTPCNHSMSIFDTIQDFIRYLKDERRASPLTLDSYERDLLRFATVCETQSKL